MPESRALREMNRSLELKCFPTSSCPPASASASFEQQTSYLREQFLQLLADRCIFFLLHCLHGGELSIGTSKKGLHLPQCVLAFFDGLKCF